MAISPTSSKPSVTTTTRQVGRDLAWLLSVATKHMMCVPSCSLVGCHWIPTSAMVGSLITGPTTETPSGKGLTGLRPTPRMVGVSERVRAMEMGLSGLVYVTSCGRRGVGVAMEGGALLGTGGMTMKRSSAVTYK